MPGSFPGRKYRFGYATSRLPVSRDPAYLASAERGTLPAHPIPVFLYFNFARVSFASPAPENFGSNSTAFLSSVLASSLSPFL